MVKNFDGESVYRDNDKYIKTKINSYGDKVNTNFPGKKIPKENTWCKCLSLTLIRLGFLRIVFPEGGGGGGVSLGPPPPPIIWAPFLPSYFKKKYDVKLTPPAVLGLIILDSGIKVNKKYYPQTLLK